MRLDRVASGAVTWRWPMVMLSALTSLVVTVDSSVASSSADIVHSWQPETLRSISQLHIRVAKDCRFGASAERLQAGVENYLRRSGLPVSSNSTNQRVAPYLNLLINCGSTTLDTTLSISLDVIQNVQLNGQTIQAETYSGPGVHGYTTAAEYTRREPQIITDLLDTFISDWNAVR